MAPFLHPPSLHTSTPQHNFLSVWFLSLGLPTRYSLQGTISTRGDKGVWTSAGSSRVGQSLFATRDRSSESQRSAKAQIK
jgi:hypothetical protein